MRVYLDSCLVIYLIERQEPWSKAMQDRLLHAASQRIEVGFSDLTRLECRVGPKSKGDLKALADFDRFFAAPDFQRFELETRAYDCATDLRAAFRLKTPDALHLAVAISAGCDEFWTNDKRLLSAAAGRIRIVSISEPLD